MTLAIDLETYSDADLKKCGLYRYVDSPNFQILLLAYRYDAGPVEVVDLLNEPVPQRLIDDIKDPNVLKTAFNAAFEIACLSKFLHVALDPSAWSCTMALSAQCGLPLSLDAVGKVLNLDQQKDARGKALIKYFCLPCKPTNVNGQRTRNFPQHAPEKWQAFKEYCAGDVATETAIRQKLKFFNVPETEVRLWALDQKINTRGVGLDRRFVENAIRLDTETRRRLISRAIKLTGLTNPNSTSQLKAWLERETGTTIESLNKKALPDVLDSCDSDRQREVVRIRQELGKTSVKKYVAMQAAICDDDRVRGLLQYYGANRTGRWAGRLVQVQNLPKNHISDLDNARNAVLHGDVDILEMCFGNVPDTLSQLIRTAFVARDDHHFIVADFSAIEARVIAWLACERWRINVFNTHGKIYEASAAQMFKVPIETIGKGSDLRSKGKVAELALGYQGGPGALIAMGALDMGLKENELQGLVDAWRAANPAIVRYWKDIQRAAIKCVETAEATAVQNIRFEKKNNILYAVLPSGRRLCYVRPVLKEGKFGPSLQYEGMDQETKKWGRVDTYGGKLVENIVQAVARDLLAEAMLRLDAKGYSIVMHVHDEVVIEHPERFDALEDVGSIMGQSPVWAKGLPLTADCYITKYYKKD